MTATSASCSEYLSSTMRLAPSKEAWDDLSSKLHNYSRTCFLDETTPDLLNDFTRVERVYQNFSRQTKTIFNNTRPSKSNIGIRPTSAVEKTCLELIDVWIQFCHTFKECKSDGLGPVYKLMGDRFTFWLKCFKRFRRFTVNLSLSLQLALFEMYKLLLTI